MAAEHEYRLASGELVRWAFDRVISIQKTQANLESGTEVFTRYLRTAEADSLRIPFDEDSIDFDFPPN